MWHFEKIKDAIIWTSTGLLVIKYKRFIHKNAFEYVICKMVTNFLSFNALQWCVGVVRTLENFSAQFWEARPLDHNSLNFLRHMCVGCTFVCCMWVSRKKSGWIINPAENSEGNVTSSGFHQRWKCHFIYSVQPQNRNLFFTGLTMWSGIVLAILQC